MALKNFKRCHRRRLTFFTAVGDGVQKFLRAVGSCRQRLKLFCDVRDSACPDHIDLIYYRRRASQAAKRKGDRETGGKVTRGGIWARGRCGTCFFMALPHSDVIRTVARPPPPLQRYPILNNSEASAMDLCDSLSMEVMGTKTDIGQ
jgi:hypothetical protein